MYKSALDPSGALEFAFDPLRALHAHEDSRLQWPEYPYKQVTIDRRLELYFKLSSTIEKMKTIKPGGRSWNGDSLKNEQHFDRPREFIRSEKAKVVSILDAQAAGERAQQEQDELAAWGARQIVKRYEDGNKYDGDGVTENGVSIPHGYGTLWVPEEKYTTTVGRAADIKRVIRYVGEWKNGLMYGNGTYFWASGESWKGNFIRDEMQGKGVYTSSEGDSDEPNSSRDTGRDGKKTEQELRPNQRIRYFDAGQHVCWGDELVCGCRVRLFNNRHFGDPLVSVVKRSNVGLEVETEAVVVRYDPQTDRHLVRMVETEKTRWISLSNSNFRVLASRPIARFLDE
ncbi:hypothetical protein PPTG_00823 [Phytophthora nicotianae INRA-310]|uniref:Uncharacterized protein n=1 Tax=Phytophthora nicotianae (strain INRA-310) TaxID=761204 RepID=W2RIX8_PHYN3|nr:hypothetical protein PPTG_00823 [Phytophthora nicotianae INRA-310]ETN24565.1 hypothetical protein PPTG_00823 [Phytophthora nicotianae INRA-310]